MKNYIITSNGVAHENFDDETVIVNMPVGHYYSLRNSAHEIIKLISSGTNEEEVSKMLQDKYGLEQQTSLEESRAFLSRLNSINLLSETESIIQYCYGNAEPLAFVSPVIETFNDMEELLKLDPVHDVDSMEGWPLKK